jgi:hypothetical protein
MDRFSKLRRCPRCGGKELQVEESHLKGMVLVHCMDCESVFEMHDRTDRKQRRRNEGGGDRRRRDDRSVADE